MRERTRSQAARGVPGLASSAKRLTVVLLVGSALVVVSASAGWAGTRGLVARASAATSTGGQAQPPLVSLPGGGTASLSRMTDWVAANVFDGRAIVVHDLGTGATFEALPDAEGVGVVPFEGGASLTLGDMIDEPGAIVFFESPAVSPPDPVHAERFEVIYAAGGARAYIARPVFTVGAPEPGMGIMWSTGGLLVAALARRRGRRGSPALRQS